MHRMFEVAKDWCDENPKWKRICDIEDSDAMALTWDELPQRDRTRWEQQVPHAAEEAWREFCANIPYRHRFGFVGEDGVFYDDILAVPQNTNSVMVFETGGKRGIYYNGGQQERSSQSKAALAT